MISVPAIQILRREWVYLLAVALAVFGTLFPWAERQNVAQCPPAVEEMPDLIKLADRLTWRDSSIPSKLAIGGGATILMILVGAGALSFCALKLVRRRPLLSQAPIQPAAWGMWDVFKIAAVYVAAHMISGGFLHEERANPMEDPLALSGEFGARIAVSAAIVHTIIMRTGGTESLRRIWRKPIAGMKSGVVAYFAFLPLYLGLGITQTLFWRAVGAEPTAQESVRIVVMARTRAALIAMGTLAVIVAPLTEELYFRGMLQSLLRNHLAGRESVLAGAMLFACVHFNWFALLPIFALGVVLGYLYERTQSLVPSVVVHMLHNGVMLAGLLWIRWLFQE